MVFGGCSSAEKQKIDRVDSLYSVIEAVEDSMEMVSIAKVNRLIDENQNLLIKVQNQTKDTLTKEQMFFCSDFKRYRKTLTQLVQNIEFQVGQIGYSKTQLENLKEDVKNGLKLMSISTIISHQKKNQLQDLKNLQIILLLGIKVLLKGTMN